MISSQGLGASSAGQGPRRVQGGGEAGGAVPIEPVEADAGEGSEVAVAGQAVAALLGRLLAGAAAGIGLAEVGIAEWHVAPHEAGVVAERAIRRRRGLSV